MIESTLHMRTVVTVDDERFELQTDTIVPAVKADIEGALRAGGGFVVLPTIGDRAVDILVTPGTRVRITRETDVTPSREDALVMPPLGALHFIEDI